MQPLLTVHAAEHHVCDGAAEAEGAHSYPHGIHKYYDIFSFRGYVRYLIDYATVYIIELTGRLTIIPIDFIHAWYDEKRDNSNWKLAALIYGIRHLQSPLTWPITDWIFGMVQIEVERGFIYDH